VKTIYIKKMFCLSKFLADYWFLIFLVIVLIIVVLIWYSNNSCARDDCYYDDSSEDDCYSSVEDECDESEEEDDCEKKPVCGITRKQRIKRIPPKKYRKRCETVKKCSPSRRGGGCPFSSCLEKCLFGSSEGSGNANTCSSPKPRYSKKCNKKKRC